MFINIVQDHVKGYTIMSLQSKSHINKNRTLENLSRRVLFVGFYLLKKTKFINEPSKHHVAQYLMLMFGN